MNESQRLFVRESIESLSDDVNSLSQHFYRHLLTEHPELSAIFSGSVATLNKKFFNMLALLKNVKHLEKIEASIHSVGQRHATEYGALTEHLPQIKHALMAALAEQLGDRFSPQLQKAWSTVYDEVAEIFARAMESAEASGAVATDQGPGKEFLDAIGGADAVMRVHMRFYPKIFEHPWLGYFFRGKHEDILARKQTEFMVAAFGGENHYKGDTPAFVHMHMFITEEQLQLREALLREAILAEGISEEAAEQWLAVDRSFWSSIQKQSPDECVMKCFGQVPIIAPEPRTSGKW